MQNQPENIDTKEKVEEKAESKQIAEEQPFPDLQDADQVEVKPRSRRQRGVRHTRGKFPLVVVLILLLLVLVGAYGAYRYVRDYMPTKERADLTEYFDVAGDNVQVYLNEERQKNEKDYLVIGRFAEGHVYLPYEYVQSTLNRRFYWQEDEQVFLYSKPTETELVDSTATLDDGSHAFFIEGNRKFLNIDWVAKYTNIRYHQNVEGEHKRIFIYNNWDSYPIASLTKAESVRVKGGVKSPILTDLEAGSEVKILESMENWSLVSTEDGFQGYVRNSRLSTIEDFQPESNYNAPEFTHIQLANGQKVELGFHQVTNTAANENLSTLIENPSTMNVIAPTWIAINTDNGDFISYASANYVSLAHERGYQVWVTVNNVDHNVDESVFLKNRMLRANLISNLVKSAQEIGIDGINIDFELISESLAYDYVQFMRELSIACRNAGIILSVDVYVPFSYNAYYDLEELGTYCDYVIIMCYDEHYAGSEEAGSTASISYVNRGITEGLKLVDSSQLIIALPFYTRLWTTDNAGNLSSEAYGISRTLTWVSENNVELVWDEMLGQNYGSIEDDTGKREIWLEDSRSMTLKMQYVKEAGLAGVAAWKLGLEPEGFWSILSMNE